MPYIPHPSVPLGHLRPYDIILLLSLGAAWELICRVVLMKVKRKPTAIKRRELALKELERDIVYHRSLGPQAFVKTSKLERQQLAEEKELGTLAEERKAKLSKIEKIVRKVDLAICAVIFILWYGISIMEFSAHRVDTPMSELLSAEQGQELAISSFKAFLFPLSFVGLGIKISKWGLASPKSSTGALLVFWSAQTTVAKLMDGVEALYL